MKAHLFPLGECLITPGASDLCFRLKVPPADLIMRHLSGDWGTTNEEDAAANRDNLHSGNRLMSVYVLSVDIPSSIWVITEADRSVTTLLLPDEY